MTGRLAELLAKAKREEFVTTTEVVDVLLDLALEAPQSLRPLLSGAMRQCRNKPRLRQEPAVKLLNDVLSAVEWAMVRESLTATDVEKDAGSPGLASLAWEAADPRKAA